MLKLIQSRSQIDFRQKQAIRERWALKRCPDLYLFQLAVFWANLLAIPHLRGLNSIEQQRALWPPAVFGVVQQAGLGSGSGSRSE